jgi:hypothetical protein
MVNTSANGEVAIGFRSADDALGSTGHWMFGKNLGGLSNDELSFYNGVGGNKMTFTTAGNLGVGTTSPWTTLSVNGSSDLGNSALAGFFTGTTTATSTLAGGLSSVHLFLSGSGGCV